MGISPSNAGHDPKTGGEAGLEDVGADAVRAELQRLVVSPDFARSKQLRRFLEYTVERTLSGQSEGIKEYTIALEVFGRDDSYDPRVDPIVRTEARRLRTKLEKYYEHAGRERDGVRIRYPKGGYVPEFEATGARRSRSIAAPLAITGALLAVAGLVLAGWLLRTGDEAITRPRIVVLPFDDFSPDEPNEAFALAITESVLTRLARVEGLDVVSRTSVMSFEQTSLGLSEIAETFGPDYLIEGSVVRHGDACRISAQLIRMRDESHVWAQEYDFDWGNVFEIQDTVSRDLADQMISLGVPAAANKAPTRSLPAYSSYIKGRHSLIRFNNTRREHHFAEAERRLQRALELDPDYADAWANLAHLHYMRLYPPRAERGAILETSRSYAQKALELDPENVTALFTLGSVYGESGRAHGGVELCRKAVETDPSDAQARALLGGRYAALGFYESALFEYERALELDPIYANAAVYSVRWGMLVGRHDQVLGSVGSRDGELFGESQVLDVFQGDAHYRLGEFQKAEEIWRESAAKTGELPQYLEVALGLAAAQRGDLDEGRRIWNKYAPMPPRALDHLIQLGVVLGEHDAVIARLDLPGGHPTYGHYRFLATEPALEPLAAEPAFVDLLNRLHARWLTELEILGPSLPVLPPELPSPDAYVARVAHANR